MRYLTVAAAAAVILLAACSSQSSSTTAPAPLHSPAAARIASRMALAGMPIRNLLIYTAASDPNHLMGRQGGYTSKVAWDDPRAARQDAGDKRGSVGLGGGIEVYSTAAGARQRDDYLKGFKPPFGDGWDYVAGTAVLRLSQYLTPGQAAAYKAAFTKAAS